MERERALYMQSRHRSNHLPQRTDTCNQTNCRQSLLLGQKQARVFEPDRRSANHELLLLLSVAGGSVWLARVILGPVFDSTGWLLDNRFHSVGHCAIVSQSPRLPSGDIRGPTMDVRLSLMITAYSTSWFFKAKNRDIIHRKAEPTDEARQNKGFDYVLLRI